MKSWFVVYTQAQREPQAKQHLLDQGFEVYLPRFKKIRRHARKVQEVLTPLFPRYLFVALDLDDACWRSVNGTRGVVYILMHDERPAIVPKEIVQSLKAQEDAEGVVPLDSMALFSKGDKVRVLEGTFKDYTAVFTALTDKDRVQLLLNFLGRELKVSLPSYAIEAA